MPRGRPSQSAQRKAVLAMRYEQMCHAALTARRAQRPEKKTCVIVSAMLQISEFFAWSLRR